MDSKILIVAGDKIVGPFPNQDTAQAWIDAPHDVGTAYELYSLHDTVLGTAERADQCGSRLPGIAEATTRNRKAGSAG